MQRVKLLLRRVLIVGKKMVSINDDELNEHGVKFTFAGAQKDTLTKFHVTLKFLGKETFKAFGSELDLTANRTQAGAVRETGVMSPEQANWFTIYSEAHIKC